MGTTFITAHRLQNNDGENRIDRLLASLHFGTKKESDTLKDSSRADIID